MLGRKSSQQDRPWNEMTLVRLEHDVGGFKCAQHNRGHLNTRPAFLVYANSLEGSKRMPSTSEVTRCHSWADCKLCSTKSGSCNLAHIRPYATVVWEMDWQHKETPTPQPFFVLGWLEQRDKKYCSTRHSRGAIGQRMIPEQPIDTPQRLNVGRASISDLMYTESLPPVYTSREQRTESDNSRQERRMDASGHGIEHAMLSPPEGFNRQAVHAQRVRGCLT